MPGLWSLWSRVPSCTGTGSFQVAQTQPSPKGRRPGPSLPVWSRGTCLAAGLWEAGALVVVSEDRGRRTRAGGWGHGLAPPHPLLLPWSWRWG